MDARLVLRITDGEVICDYQIEDEEKVTPEVMMKALVKAAKALGEETYTGGSAELGRYLWSQIEEEFGKVTIQ